MHHIVSLQQVQSLYLVLLPKLKSQSKMQKSPNAPTGNMKPVKRGTNNVKILKKNNTMHFFVKRFLRHLAPSF